jgi:MFS family permease
MVGPLMFGFAMDHGAPQWVFGISVILMIAVAIVALVGDRRTAANRRRQGQHAAASAD